jgi:hypothetical protein
MNGYLSISGLICEWEGVQESKMETTKWIGVYDCSSSCFLNDTSFYWIYIYIYIWILFYFLKMAVTLKQLNMYWKIKTKRICCLKSQDC